MANDGSGAPGHADDGTVTDRAEPDHPVAPTPPGGVPTPGDGPAKMLAAQQDSSVEHPPAHAIGVPRPDPDPVTPPAGTPVPADADVPAAAVDPGSDPGVGPVPGGGPAAVDPTAVAGTALDAPPADSPVLDAPAPIAAPALPATVHPGGAARVGTPPGGVPAAAAREAGRSHPQYAQQPSSQWPPTGPPQAQQPPTGWRPAAGAGDTVHLPDQQPPARPGPQHPGPRHGQATGQHALQQPTAQHAAQQPWPQPGGPPPERTVAAPGGGEGRPRRRGGLAAAMVALALVAALVGGGVGGYVGYRLADRGQTPASSGNVLNEPLPDVDQNPAAQGPVEAVATRVLPSTVQLRVTGARSEGEGSGMILSADGLILTNNHVVADAANGGTVTAVFQDGRSVPATIVGRDPSSDLAVVRATDVTGLVPIELGNSDGVRVGQPVVAFGSPLGLGGTVTTGIISALDRAVGVGDELAGSDPTVFSALQTDAAINPGNSGGPLVDMQGRVIGINSAIATTGSQGGSIGVGFAIPVNSAKRIAQELETTGRATRAVLGVGVGDDQSVTGARIQSVVPGGPADAAGIKAGDVVRKFGDKQITTGLDLQAQIRSAAPGATLPVQLADRTVQVTLGSATG
ncbi:trypsin-like peptidase domain-containing protein [Pseudonocardia sp.]|jgi:putative serine protease PepD|uniref:S1C family serine protease n=1 Tax=Pseudonocardia sp. TaxID=60912 RepID=UPI003D0DBB1F